MLDEFARFLAIAGIGACVLAYVILIFGGIKSRMARAEIKREAKMAAHRAYADAPRRRKDVLA